ncbi:hypothetical protein Tco_0654701 [Tanacetum coccineum]|uniref:Uncharacterized protein n=1 Tax=Tanacetum coccineum TaxID=301880 RepID=A0ABQ4X485_9ASTR
MVPEQVKTKKIQAGVQVSRLEDKDVIFSIGSALDVILFCCICMDGNIVKRKYVARNTGNGQENEESTDSYETLRRNPHDSGLAEIWGGGVIGIAVRRRRGLGVGVGMKGGGGYGVVELQKLLMSASRGLGGVGGQGFGVGREGFGFGLVAIGDSWGVNLNDNGNLDAYLRAFGGLSGAQESLGADSQFHSSMSIY